MAVFADSKEVGTSATNRQYPTMMDCAVSKSSVTGTVAEYFSIKTNKYVNLSDSQEVEFDVVGVWQNEQVVKELFDMTPMYLRDFHEGVGEFTEEEKTC